MILSAGIFFTFFFLLASGFYSGAEIVVTSANKATLRNRAEKGERKAQVAKGMIDNIEKMLTTTLVGINLTNVCATTIAASLIHIFYPGEFQSVLNTLVMTPLVLVFAELVPKAIGRTHADRLVTVIARPLQISEAVMYPLVKLCSSCGNAVASLFRRESTRKAGSITREDLQAMAEVGHEEGVLTDTTAEMMNTVLVLDRRPVSAVMKPLAQMIAIQEEAAVEEVERIAVETGYSRFPVYRGRIDEVVGIVDLRRVLYDTDFETFWEQIETNMRVKDFIDTDVVFVPESKPAGHLLRELRFHKVPAAIVVDEHGGVVGLVTIEDLVEEVVGEIQDERDQETHGVVKISDSVYECDGSLELRELAQCLELDLDPESTGCTTVAGLIMKRTGRIPDKGETLQIESYIAKVVEISNRRIEKIQFYAVKNTGTSEH